MGIDALEAKICAQTSDTLREGLRSKDVLTTPEAAIFLGVCKTTVFRYVALGLLPMVQLPGKNLFRREDLESLINTRTDSNSCSPELKMTNDASELTTVKSAAKYYGISPTSLYTMMTNNGVVPVKFAGFTYFRKEEIRAILGKTPMKDVIKTQVWATHEQIEFEYRMTRTAVTRMLRDLNIPSKLMNHTTYFSMDHLRARKKEEDDKFNELYYTVPQIMEKYFLQEPRIYKILRRYHITHFKSGVTIVISRNEFDKIMGVPEFTL